MKHDPSICRFCVAHRQGKSPNQMARELNVGRSRVYAHLKWQGLTPNPPQPMERPVSLREQFWDLREQGLSVSDAASRLEMSPLYARTLGRRRPQEREQKVTVEGGFPSEDAYVAALIAAGGFERLSEKPTRTGPVVCLPIIPFVHKGKHDCGVQQNSGFAAGRSSPLIKPMHTLNSQEQRPCLT